MAKLRQYFSRNQTPAITSKICPSCGSVLVIRTNKFSGKQFVGCSEYPKCKHAEELPEDIIMMQNREQMLPGMRELVEEDLNVSIPPY